MRALVVDDASVMRGTLSEIVRGLGFEMFDAEDGEDGLAVLGAVGVVELILVDWKMPKMDGLQFVRRVREDETYAATRIMMVSTESAMECIVQALDAGADEYLMKPFTREAVTEKLALLGLMRK